MPAGSNVRVALGHHHDFYITCKIVLGKAGQQARTRLRTAQAGTGKSLLLGQRYLNVSQLALGTLSASALQTPR